MSNVTSIRGAEIMPPGIPVPGVVDVAERMLEMAKSGQINSISAAVQCADSSTEYHCAGEVTNSVIGTIERMKRYLLSVLD
jgi:hypothetical protein